VARILLVEDDDALARGLVKTLHARGFAVDHAEDGEQALMMVSDEPYAVMILDLGLPDVDGFEVLRALRNSANKIPVLILTARDQIHDRVIGLDLGADDYVLKPFDLDELSARLRALMRRPAGDPSPALQVGALSVDRSNCTATIEGAVLDLRRREWMLLESLVAQRGKVVSKERLSAEIFTFEDTVSPNVIELYIGRLRRKLGPKAPTIRTVRGLGYIMENA
jgi:two-component system OmpR family response regulator